MDLNEYDLKKQISSITKNDVEITPSLEVKNEVEMTPSQEV